MKKIILFYIIISIAFTELIYSQQEELSGFDAPRFARVIRFGDAFTGAADGPESAFYNVAGLSDINSFNAVFSKGQGLGIVSKDVNAFDYAFVYSISEKIGTVGISVNELSYVNPLTYEKKESWIYNFHYARKINENISAGGTINYSRVKKEIYGNIAFGDAYDFNIACLLKAPDFMLLAPNDKFQFGIQLNNLLNSLIQYDATPQTEYKYQSLRMGMYYCYTPEFQKILESYPLMIAVAFDAVFSGYNYKAHRWRPNIGFEATFFEILQASYGRENKINIEQNYSTPQYPVKRYGFGVLLPINKWAGFSRNLQLKFDYSFSDWDKIDEKNGKSEYLDLNSAIEQTALSFGINAEF